MAPPPTPDPTAKPGGPKAGDPASGNPFTRKIGPLPGWAWVGIAVGGVLLYLHFRGTSSASTTTGTTTDGDTDDDADDDADDADSLASLLEGMGSGQYESLSPGNGGSTGTTTDPSGGTAPPAPTVNPGGPAQGSGGGTLAPVGKGPAVTSPGKVAKAHVSVFGTGTNYSLEKMIGSGYNADDKGGFVGKKTGRDFSAIQPNSAQVAQMVSRGDDDLYYQSAKGVATRITKANDTKLKKGTPIFTVRKNNVKKKAS